MLAGIDVSVRRFDDLGRIVIPRTVREKALGTTNTEGMEMEISYKTDGTIILKPYTKGLEREKR